MSSVSGSGGGQRNDEALRRQREEYRKREGELVKKHHQEVRRLSEAHDQELQNVKASHAERMQQANNNLRSKVTNRDRQHQKEIQALKALHQKQVVDLSQTHDQKSERLIESVRSERARNKAANEYRLEDLKDHFRGEIQKKDQQMEQRLKEVREDQQEAISRNKEVQASQHNQVMDSLKKDRDTRMADMRRDYTYLRKQTADRMEQQELHHRREKKRLADSAIDGRERLLKAQAENEEVLREGFQGGLERQREKFEDKNSELRRNQEHANQNFRSTVEDRLDRQVSSLEKQVKDLKMSSVRDQIRGKRQKEKELLNLRDNFNDNRELLENQRKMTLEATNQEKADDIKKIRKDLDQQMVDTNRFYRETLQMKDLKSQQALDSITTDMQAANEQQKLQGELRMGKVREDAANEVERLREYYDKNLDMLKLSHNEEELELRKNLEKEKNAAIERAKERMNQVSLKNEEKTLRLISSYEKQVAELNDRFLREKRLSNSANQRTVDEMKRLHSSQMEQVKLQYEDKLAAINSQHDREVKTMRDRHQKQIDEILVAVRRPT